MKTNDTVIYIDFTKDELMFIDAYAKVIGEDREALLQRILKKVIAQIERELLATGTKDEHL